MKKYLSNANEIEYDFELWYPVHVDCPFKPGDEVKSPVTDGFGRVVSFCDRMIHQVVAMECNSDNGIIVYVAHVDESSIFIFN
jgi:hypothetical protein